MMAVSVSLTDQDALELVVVEAPLEALAPLELEAPLEQSKFQLGFASWEAEVVDADHGRVLSLPQAEVVLR